MNQDHDALQIIGSVLLIIYSGLLLMVRGVKALEPLWRDALMLAALYSLVATAVRMGAYWQLLGQLEARVLNGMIVAVFLSTLLILIVGQFLARRAAAKCGS
jgi:hypothetical protein